MLTHGAWLGEDTMWMTRADKEYTGGKHCTIIQKLSVLRFALFCFKSRKWLTVAKANKIFSHASSEMQLLPKLPPEIRQTNERVEIASEITLLGYKVLNCKFCVTLKGIVHCFVFLCVFCVGYEQSSVLSATQLEVP